MTFSSSPGAGCLPLVPTGAAQDGLAPGPAMADEARSLEARDIDRAWQQFSSASRTQASKPGPPAGTAARSLTGHARDGGYRRAWQGPVLTKRSTLIDKNRTNFPFTGQPRLLNLRDVE